MSVQRAQSNRSVYLTIGGLNLCVGIMFFAVLFPKPALPVLQPSALAVSPKIVEIQTRKAKVGTPIRVVVPAVNIDNDVRTGSYTPENQSWTLDDYSAFHADRTVAANDSNGVTLIYGHANQNVFGRLPDIQPGSQAQVFTQEGLIFTYEYESNRQVEPTDVSVLTTEGPPRLVLQTCSGPFDVYRSLVTFNLVEVSKA